MLLGVVSDTHGHVQNAQAAARMLESSEVQAVLHCGDIGSEHIVPVFSKWPTHFVFGNVDDEFCDKAIKAAIEQTGQTLYGRFGEIELADVKIAILHGDDQRRLNETIAGGKYALVCHGHTHVPRWEKVGRTFVLNPGALYRAQRHTVAIIELPSLKAEIIAV